jgi:hypothetical protein
MAEKEYLTERIKYLGDWLKLVSIFLLAVGGGTISLLLGDLTPTKTVLAVLGAGLTIALAVGGRVLDRQIRQSLDRLKEI